MKIAVPLERRSGEKRVAASPETVKKLVGLGQAVTVETGAGAGAGFSDADYQQAGATIAADPAALFTAAEIVFRVQRPLTQAEGTDEVALIPHGATLIGLLQPMQNRDQVKAYAERNVTAFALELLPRISRAQSMDVLSSQANLAGYKAVAEAANAFGRVFPMMMTAAGTVAPARVLIMGVGVAGLQAIATAKRLGAIVSATDVRPATKEQVQSLGATFLMVEDEESRAAETAGGYAKEMSDAYKQKQAALIRDNLKKMDIVITTALIPGRPAPVLLTADMVADMKPGSVIVDLAVEAGGNCELSKLNEVIVERGVTIIGYANLPSRIATDASTLYAKNLLHFITPLIDKESKALRIDWEDEIVRGTALTRDGAVIHPGLK
jgi:NAD(P) transhydrogenase subunit alpha